MLFLFPAPMHSELIRTFLMGRDGQNACARVLDEARMPDVLIGLRKPHRLRFSEESDVLTGRTLATSVIPSSPIPLLLKLTSLSKGH